ncbi:hypothetical protein EDB83DRAFT_2359795 [Lactarius deliciosus]|nr:hypothetical protein EDB83DRAFT_2359795 [Lactarius deliciosus]
MTLTASRRLVGCVRMLRLLCIYLGVVEGETRRPPVDLPGRPPEEKVSDYGMVIRMKAPLWNDRLWIPDPKANQYILQITRYNSVKPYAARLHPQRDSHYRQRQILSSAFGSSESKAQVPIFRECAHEFKNSGAE